MAQDISILFIGDIVGRLGRAIVKKAIPELKASRQIDLVIANGENSSGGYGITEKVCAELTDSGVEVITMGNHMFDKKDFPKTIEACGTVVRPANYPPGTVGKDFFIKEVKGAKVGVINLVGRVFMQPLDCPFRAAEALVKKLKGEAGIIFVDFHAEATSEKAAFGYFLDGTVSAIVGTHTHVMTADEKVLDGGTAYISDVGMTGAYDSVIGMQKREIISRFITQLPTRFEPVRSGDGMLNAVLIKIDPASGKAMSIERIFKRYGESELPVFEKGG